MKFDNILGNLSSQVGKSRAKAAVSNKANNPFKENPVGKKLEEIAKTMTGQKADTPFKGSDSIRSRMEGYGRGDAATDRTPKKGTPDSNSNAAKLEDITTRSEKEGYTEASEAAGIAAKAGEKLDLIAQSSDDPSILNLENKYRLQLDKAIDKLKAAVESGDKEGIKEASAEIAEIGKKVDRLADQAGPLIPRDLIPQ
jgi:hypothetical protein